MNLSGDWRYVSKKDIEIFGGRETRIQSWGVQGYLGRTLRNQEVSVNVAGKIFVHGGISPSLNFLDVGSINERAKQSFDSNWADPIFQSNGPLWHCLYLLCLVSRICNGG